MGMSYNRIHQSLLELRELMYDYVIPDSSNQCESSQTDVNLDDVADYIVDDKEDDERHQLKAALR